jgi:pimeloyl-ACP methyl ester carboxylesterase
VATVRANGVDLRVNRYRVGPPGERPVVVFLHGLGIVDHSGLSFTLGMPLAADADVLLYALRGHGHSETPPSGYRLVDHVGDLVALLDAVGLDAPVHVVGCSYGGAIATLTAIHHPERVASLFLLDPLLPVGGWTRHILPTMEQAAAMLRQDYQVEDVMAALGLTSRRKASAVAERAHRLLVGTTLLDDLRLESALDPDDFGRVRCPVAAVFGDQSEMHPFAARLQGLVPSAAIHTIAGADHLQIFGHTAELGRLIRDFVLDQTPSGPRPDRSARPTVVPPADRGPSAPLPGSAHWPVTPWAPTPSDIAGA